MNSLIQLFNAEHDLVRKVGDEYQPVRPPLRPTHKLVCTRWNNGDGTETNFIKFKRSVLTRPKGWALAVCAMPLRRRKKPEPKGLVVVRPLQDLPVYRARGPLAGRRAVLCAFARQTRHPMALRRTIAKATGARCNTLWRQLLRANRRARRKQLKRERRLKAQSRSG